MSVHGPTGGRREGAGQEDEFGDSSSSASELTDRHHDAGAAQQGAQQGADSVRQLFDEHIRAIYQFIYSNVGNRETAEDLAAQVFTKATRGIDSDRRRESIQAWLFQVARTVVADHLRAFYRLRTTDSLDNLLAAGWDMSDVQETAELTSPPAERVERILGQLPTRYREVLTYRFLLDYSIRETATQMRLTEGNVMMLQYWALKKAAALNPNLV